MSFRVRSSKFRHVFGNPYKKEVCYEGIKISKNAHDNGFCAVNPKFLSVVTETAGGGSFVVIPLDKVGRVDINTPKVCGHTGPILDIKWNPFHDNIISSASEDATVKLWQIPEQGLESNVNDWMIDLHGHTRRVGYIEWHPTAENVLLSAGYDHNCILWNVETAEPVNIISVHPENIFSLAWNHDGSLFATTCKDKNLRVVDPRQGNIVSECISHQGNKASKVTFLGNKNRLFTTGSSKMCERQYGIWDMRNMSKPLRMDEIDSSSGVMFLFYDQDTNVMFLAGKGDGNIRYFEVVDDAPHIHYLSQYQSSSPQRGLGFMPKRGLEPSKCEIVRFYKLHTAKPLVEPVSMIVPRKSEVFQDDIYPPTASAVPSLSAEEWIAGSNRDPILMSLKDGQILASAKSNITKAPQKKPLEREVNNNHPGSQPPTASLYTEQTFNMSSHHPSKGDINYLNNNPQQLTGNQPIINKKTNINSARNHATTNSVPADTNGFVPRKITIIHSSQVNSNSRRTPTSVSQTKKSTSANTPKSTNSSSNSASSGRSSYGRESRASVTKVHRSVAMTPVHSVTKAPRLKATETSGPVVNRISRNRSVLVTKDTMLGKDVVTKGTTPVTKGNSVVTKGSSSVAKRSVAVGKERVVGRGNPVTRETVINRNFNQNRTKDGGIVPTITTYKAVKRGQSLVEPPTSNAKRSSPMTKAASLDHTPDRPEKIPASVRNIAKLSQLDDVKENTQPNSPDHVDVQNRIGMFENKNQTSPTSPEKRWSTQYHNSVKTEVTAAGNHTYQQNNNEEYCDSPTTHQPVSPSRISAATASISHHQPDKTGYGQKLSHQTGINQQARPAVLHTTSIDNGELSDDSEISDLTSPVVKTPHQQISRKKKAHHSHGYRRRRENKILNESSDMEMFTTPPTSPGGDFGGGASTPSLSIWNQNPLFSEDAAASNAVVDISALDDALQDFEDLSKTFHPNTAASSSSSTVVTESVSTRTNKESFIQPKQSSRQVEVVPQQIISLNSNSSRDKVIKTKREREISRSKPDVSNSVGSFSNDFAVNLPPDSPSDLSPKYDLSKYTSLSSGHIPSSSYSGAPAASHSYERISPDLKMPSTQVSSESREMIDMMSNEAPDNTLIKPSKLRASLRSKRRHTQEITMREEKSPSPELNMLGNFQRGNSFRDNALSRNYKDDNDTSKLRRVNSLRDRTRNSREINIVEMTTNNSVTNAKDNSSFSSSISSKKKEMNNNQSVEMNGRISPTQVSRPLQLALDMDTGQNKPQRRDSFKSSTKVQLHSPTMIKSPTTVKSPTIIKSPSPVHKFNSVHSPVQAHSQVQAYSAATGTNSVHSYSPLHSYSPGPTESQSGKLTFSTTSVEDKNPDKVLFSPVDGGSGLLYMGRRRSSSNMDDTENKIHVKKVWSPRSPSQPEPFVYENGEEAATHVPSTDPELRKAYFRQLEEIESLKQQISYKDKRIRQLEEELRMLRVPAGADESTC